MDTFTYSKIPLSIEDTPFSYVINIDDYRTLSHILEVIVQEKVSHPILKGIFNKILKTIDNTTNSLSKCLKDSRTIDLKKLERLTKNGEKLLILVNNPDYYSFASYTKGFENNVDNLVFSNAKCVLYNVGQLEFTGSISVVPSNANVFLSSLLYAYTLLNNAKLYNKLNTDVLCNLGIVYYSMMLSSFGRKSGLLVSERRKKEFLFFLSQSLVYSIYVPNNKSIANLKQFLAYCSSVGGNAYLNEYLVSLSKVINESKDIWDKDNYNSFEKLSILARRLDLLEISESEMKIQWFKLLGNYGVMGLENYPRICAYVCATYLPNSYLNSTMKIYNKNSYEYLMEYLLKDLYTFN